MRCPTCGFENLLGSDVCDNCGSDLAGRDVPEPAISSAASCSASTSTRSGSAPPEIVDPATDVDDAIRRMHDKGLDCVLVAEDGRLVGIFTDRDAVLKVAGHGARRIGTIGGADDPRSRSSSATTRRSRSRSTRWPSAASATSRSSRTAARPASSRRATSSGTSPGRWADRAVTRPRVAILAQDLVWADRLARSDRGRRRRAGPRARRAAGARSGARLRRSRDRRPDRPGLRPDRRDRTGALERGPGPRRRAARRRPAPQAGASPPAPTRSSPTASSSRTGPRRSSAGWRTPARPGRRHGSRRRHGHDSGAARRLGAPATAR